MRKGGVEVQFVIAPKCAEQERNLLSRFWAYTIVSVAIVLTVVASALWFAIHIRDVDLFAFGNAYRAFENYSRLALVIVSIPTLMALLAAWRPFFTKRVEQRH